jgi:hypothetical protein
MYKKIFSLFTLVFMAGLVLTVSAQTPTETPARQNSAAGEVVSVTEKSIVVQTKDGPIEAMLSDATSYKKIPPDNASLKNAIPSAHSEIGVGDKVLISGLVSLDKKTMPAKTVYLMTKSELAQRQAREGEWRTRGIGGKVVSVDPATNQIGIEVRGMMGATSKVTVTPKDKVRFKRYAADSAKYSEAKESSIGEIKAGDMLRALGDKGADGVTFAAEEILTGAFQTTVGVVKTVDVDKNEVVIVDAASKKEITVAITGSTLFVKQYPAELAARFAGMQAGGGGGAPTGQGPRPAGATPQGGQERPAGAGPGAGGPRGIDDMVERFPDIKVSDLKLGDTIAVVSTTKSADASHISAIKFLSGVEPFVRMAQMAAASSGGGNRGGQGGVNGNFTIPGLDGFGGP